ncbi:hypothetical protein EDB19DRAFT_1646981 [Suillus lakei]|nr:hypothetical protein EDB19DRAFT_1646981 [Suillus lakei]
MDTDYSIICYRYCCVPTFGRGTIRCFHTNASAMKCLAARDFEDLLQCVIPVFKDLLLDPDNDNIILDLLFDLATWQAYAKLHLHTEDTLNFFNLATIVLGKSVCKFQRTTCAIYITMELPHEHATQGRWLAALAAKQGALAKSKGGLRPKVKKLNINTYKFHTLGDYPNTIRLRGTTDNYTMQPVSFYFY